jgi:phosphomevalonate kinase
MAPIGQVDSQLPWGDLGPGSSGNHNNLVWKWEDEEQNMTESQLRQAVEEELQFVLNESDNLSFSEMISLEQFKDYIDTFSIGLNSTPESLANYLSQKMQEQPDLRGTIIMHLKAAIKGVKGYEEESEIAKQAVEILGLEEEIQGLLNEKAVSKKQQRFMGMVHKCQETGDCASPEVAKAAKSMKKKDAEDFASTKHKGLPEKKKKKKAKRKK